MPDNVWRIPERGVALAVLADCHISEDGPSFPPALFPRLDGADLIVTLGNMGSRRGLDRLQEIAPVLGVRGQDDEDDLRTRQPSLLLTGEGYRLGCVADARAAGLAAICSPFVESDGAGRACQRLFGGPVHILLHGGGRRSDEASFGGAGSALDPGSAVLPALGARATFLRLKVTLQGCFGQMVWVA